MNAMIEYLGKQYYVQKGDKIKVPYNGYKTGQKITIDKILFFDDGKKKIIGKPFVDGIGVNTKVLEHGKDRKIIVFKFKRRKRYQRKNGHKQQFSLLSVESITTKKSTATTTKKTIATKTKKTVATKTKKTVATKTKKTTNKD